VRDTGRVAQAILLWAAYQENSDLRIPSQIPEDFAKDPATRLNMDANSWTIHPALMSNASFWLPVRFAFVFEAPDTAGREVTIASSIFACSRVE
jgi:hypothetical protein